MRHGSLFSGYCGLDGAAQAVFGGSLAWVSDIDPGACKILAHRYPDVPNIGDITAVDWNAVEPVDVLTGGFPCQDLSHAGKRAGMRPGTRSGLWSHMAYAVDQLRPRYVIAENVRGLLSGEAHSDVEPCPWCMGDGTDQPALRALGAVLGDLADLGYDARWCGLRAADVGAPHGRFRVFVVATDAAQSRRHGSGLSRGRRDGLAHDHLSTPDAGGQRHGRGQDAGSVGRVDGEDADQPRERERSRKVAGDRGDAATADADRSGLSGERRLEFVRRDPDGCGREDGSRSDVEPPARTDPATADAQGWRDERPDLSAWQSVQPLGVGGPWGDYGPAIARWERVLGRPAPAPTQPGRTGNPQLSARFVEWMQGLSAGWVTDVPGLTRNQMLKALGNGVVPQQAEAALRSLLAMEAVA